MLESQLEVVKSPEWKELLSSSPEAADTTDPSQDSLDNAHEGFVNSEGAVSGADGTYTEIIFPDDQSGAPASQAAADTPASSAAAESESTNDSTNDSESATDHDAQ